MPLRISKWLTVIVIVAVAGAAIVHLAIRERDKEQVSTTKIDLQSVSLQGIPILSVTYETDQVEFMVAKPHTEELRQAIIAQFGEPQVDSLGHRERWSSDESTIFYEGYCNLAKNHLGVLTIRRGVTTPEAVK